MQRRPLRRPMQRATTRNQPRRGRRRHILQRQHDRPVELAPRLIPSGWRVDQGARLRCSPSMPPRLPAWLASGAPPSLRALPGCASTNLACHRSSSPGSDGDAARESRWHWQRVSSEGLYDFRLMSHEATSFGSSVKCVVIDNHHGGHLKPKRQVARCRWPGAKSKRPARVSCPMLRFIKRYLEK